MVNINLKTGVRFTVFALSGLEYGAQNELWWGDQATNLSEQWVYKEALEEAKIAAAESAEEFDESEWECPEFEIDEAIIEGKLNGVLYRIDWLGGAPLLWVFESPHKGLFRLCSPCCPGAADGDSPDADGYEAYDIPATWKRSER